MKTPACLVLALGALIAPAGAATCTVSHSNIVFGADTPMTMVVKSGQSCGIAVNAGLAVQSNTVARPPAHGTLLGPDSHRVRYAARPGYTGPNAFVMEMTGTSNSSKFGRTVTGTAHIDVDVTVVP